MMNENNNQNTMNNKKSGKDSLSFLKFKHLNINKKISYLMSAVSFYGIVIIGLVTYLSSRSSLKNIALDHMTSITELKKSSLEDYFSLVRNQIRVFSQDKMVIDALTEFKDAYESVDFEASDRYGYDDFENMKASVKNFYNTNVIPAINKNLNQNTSVDSYFDGNRKTTFLQYAYISDNPNPMGSKYLLSKTSDGTSYSNVHGKYHSNFREFAEKFGFEDIYLIDKERDNTVYSVAKKVDFAINILKDPYKETALAHAYEMVKSSKVKDYNFLSDMSFYSPSLGSPASFISAPIHDESGMIGVIVFQISKNTINNLVTGNMQWEKEGLGESGECYLVGDDFKMKSDNRRIFKNKNEYVESLELLGATVSDIEKINNLNTNINTTRVETEPVREMINGRSDKQLTRNYMGEKVISAYSPLNIKDVNWGIVSEIHSSEIFSSIRRLGLLTIILVIILLFAIALIGDYLASFISKRIDTIKDAIDKLASGQTIAKIENNQSDEIGMAALSVNQLVERLDEVSNFANAIGKGDFSYDYNAGSINDQLGKSLLEMKKSLEVAREEEKKRLVEDEKRNWSTQGIAKFGEILRSNNDNLDKLSYEIISNLVNYLNSNQGGLFLMEGEDNDDAHINLMASYAYNRQKFINKRVELGEGLIGTCVLERKTIYLKEIPNDYINITSGLGDANPNAILIVPLKSEENVLGVIEIATFNQFEEHEIEFVEKLADSIASTIISVKINAKTARLLDESNEKANALSQQEEEMRQNLEELKATQEEMNRIKKEEEEKEEERKRSEELLMSQLQEQNDHMKEQQDKLKEEKALLDAVMRYLPDYLYFKDKESKFIKNSLSHAKVNGFKNPEEMVGKTDFELHGKETAQQKFDEEQEIINSGKGIVDKLEHDISKNGVEKWVSTTKMPLLTADGECIGTFGISKDVTEFKKLEIEANTRSEELLAQEEEMRQNLEEMETIQEELSKRTYLMDALLENLPEHIYFKDQNSKFIEVSSSMLKLMGVNSKEDIIGKSDFDFFDDEHAKPAFDDEQNIIKTGNALIDKIEKEVRKDGNVSFASTTKLPLKDEQGNIVGTFGISKDITESKSIEEALAKEKMLLDALMENLPSSIYFKDKDSKFIRISKSMLDLFQTDDIKKIIGKSDFDFHGKEHAQQAFDDEQKIIKTGKAILDHVEKEQFEDGRINWVSTTKMPLKDINGNIIGTFGVSTNITSFKLLEEKYNELQKIVKSGGGSEKHIKELEKTKEALNKLRKKGKK